MVTFFGNYMFKNFDYCLGKRKFPCVFRHADVESVHKRKIKSDKANCRSDNILPNLSKIYEKLMYQQLYEHFNSILSPKQCGLLITKLSWYFLFQQLDEGVGIHNSYSRESDIKYGNPQGSVLGPLLFNTDLIDLFLE